MQPGLAIQHVQGGPEPHGPVTHGQLGCGLQPPVFQVQEQFPPALGAFAEAVDKAKNILVAPFVGPDYHQHTLAILVHPRRDVDAVRPEPKGRAAKYT